VQVTGVWVGEPVPANFSPLYSGQLLVHGMGFPPDHRTIVVVAIGSNAIIFIDTASNAVKHITYVGRAPREASFTPDGKEIWVRVRGENYVSVLDGATYEEKTRIIVPNGPGMTTFSLMHPRAAGGQSENKHGRDQCVPGFTNAYRPSTRVAA